MYQQLAPRDVSTDRLLWLKSALPSLRVLEIEVYRLNVRLGTGQRGWDDVSADDVLDRVGNEVLRERWSEFEGVREGLGFEVVVYVTMACYGWASGGTRTSVSVCSLTPFSSRCVF